MKGTSSFILGQLRYHVICLPQNSKKMGDSKFHEALKSQKFQVRYFLLYIYSYIYKLYIIYFYKLYTQKYKLYTSKLRSKVIKVVKTNS